MEDDDGDGRQAGALPGRPRLAPLTGPPSLSPFLKAERGATRGTSSRGNAGSGGAAGGTGTGAGSGSGGAFGSPARGRSASGRRERRKWTREDTLRIAYQT